MKRLHYNAPVILTFFLLCLGALLLGALSRGWTTLHLFSVYRAPLSPLFLVRLLGHVLGHADWDHFLGNMLLLLVAGPHMEEKYGSRALLLGQEGLHTVRSLRQMGVGREEALALIGRLWEEKEADE